MVFQIGAISPVGSQRLTTAILTSVSWDHCNQNNIPTAKYTNGTSMDCDNNTVQDECELTRLQQNQIPDRCELTGIIATTMAFPMIATAIAMPIFRDCENLDIVMAMGHLMIANQGRLQWFRCSDRCELGGNDCNANAIPDDCEPDCDQDGTPDECEADCNQDGQPDDCQGLEDCDGNGIPDD